jgi:hypothetical protein
MTCNIIFDENQSGIYYTSTEPSVMTVGLNALIATRKEELFHHLNLHSLKYDVGGACMSCQYKNNLGPTFTVISNRDNHLVIVGTTALCTILILAQFPCTVIDSW